MDDATQEQNQRVIRLDQKSIDGIAALYPEEMREPFSWLATFVREQCNRDIDVLHEVARKLGLEHDKTTWSRILRGLWNRDANGAERPSPVLALPRFLRAVEALRKESYLRERSGRVPFVWTSTAKTIAKFIDKKRVPDRVCRYGVVIGHTGTQKSATFLEYVRLNNHSTVVHVEAPGTPSMIRFLSDLGACYGISRHFSNAYRLERILDAVNDRRTIIVDNVQRLYNPKALENQPIFNFLQKLQDDTGCTVILSFTPVFEATLTQGASKGYFEQFIGRAGGLKNFLRLPEHAPDEDVLEIAKAFGMKDAGTHLAKLVKIAHEPGRIRRLFEDLQEGKAIAESMKQPLRFEHVLEAREED